ncbi:biotin carboxylase [Aliiglaciecola sp.]|nr:biotin carboxylase [Aliiglaciecola sp.]
MTKTNLNDERQTISSRLEKTLDSQRSIQAQKRHSKGYNTARQNLRALSGSENFIEYGQLAMAAQRQRRDYLELQSETAADGVITGIAKINQETIEPLSDKTHATALIINDYTVLAGTQGYFHHLKLDRIIDIADQKQLPVIMFTEGGGGRPGDTDITTVNSGLQCTTFSRWAGLAGVIPRIAINNGYCFAGNAALFGCADIRIATESSSIGMAGPAMIEGGGLGQYSPQEIGPIEMQAANGVVDIVAKDENHAIQIAKYCLGIFQGKANHWQAPDVSRLEQVLPEDRRYAYDMTKVINGIVDTGSFLELGSHHGKAIVTGFARLNGHSVAVIANNCKVLGGAIDVAAANKLDDFLQLCNQFQVPIFSLVDTPGFMVGPEHERQGAVKHLSQLFATGAKLSVTFVAVVLRKSYGLGAQAMMGGSTSNPSYTISWPTGEFGAMGLEGSVKLGFKKELDKISDPQQRQDLFDQLVAKQYKKGAAMEVASVLELDAVIEPAQTREVLLSALLLD